MEQRKRVDKDVVRGPPPHLHRPAALGEKCAVIGGKIWVDAKVDFSKRANLAVAAIPLVIAAGIPATQAIPIHLGSLTLTFNNLGLGALSAIVLYQLLRPGHVRDKEAEPAEVVSR